MRALIVACSTHWLAIYEDQFAAALERSPLHPQRFQMRLSWLKGLAKKNSKKRKEPDAGFRINVTPGLEMAIAHAARDARLNDCFIGLVHEGELNVVVFVDFDSDDLTFPLPPDVTYAIEEREAEEVAS